ncbi:MAG: hypothetical protein COU65_04295 [Candidatus Pacebacteria bacterium CG10_big_fil_rev_8_21_14_0_10_42_12]|nr:MAG: hypothetical protein COU65_04295 [Candidatus Pacebacteria bacterium CG10_big_fil_rev_8_21_14_0_10_42_12]
MVREKSAYLSDKELEENYAQTLGLEKIRKSEPREGESAVQYLSRLLDVYDEPAQQAYINVLAAVAKMSTYSYDAIFGYSTQVDIEPEAREAFPLYLNNGKDSDPNATNDDDLRVSMDSTVSSKLIYDLNSAAIQIQVYGKQKALRDIRDEYGHLIRKRPKLRLSVSWIIEVLEYRRLERLIKLAGEDVANQLIADVISESVTSSKMDKKISIVASKMKEIAKYITSPFSPYTLQEDSSHLTLALEDLDIFPRVGDYLIDAYREEATF